MPFTEDQIRELIKEELAQFMLMDRFHLQKLIQIADGRNIQVGRTTGTKIGTDTDQKLGFFGTTPVDKPATVNDPTDAGGTYNQTQIQSIVDRVKDIIDRLQEIGLIS